MQENASGGFTSILIAWAPQLGHYEKKTKSKEELSN